MPKQLEIDLRAVQAELRTKTFVHSKEVCGPTSDFFGEGDHGYHAVDDYTFLHLLNFEVGRSYALTLARMDIVCIQVLIGGSYSRSVGDHAELVNSATVQVSNFAEGISDAKAGTKLRGVLIGCERRHLLEHFKLNVDRVPAIYRPIFSSKMGMPHSLKLPMIPSVIVSTEEMLSCAYPEPLRSLFLSAKVTEIICAVTSQINALGPQQPLRTSADLKAQAVEAAAAIYRRELHDPPTIEQLSLRVGLNRNDLTSGFRDMFGVTPHVFSRDLRMERAQELLRLGELSISEVARRVGYGGYASFSRAYHDCCGRVPSEADAHADK